MADIELVAKIPEEMYKAIMGGMWCGNDTIGKSIANGKLLPKGHGDLVDKEVIKDNFYDEASEHMMGFRDYLHIVHFAPTIIEADKRDKE